MSSLQPKTPPLKVSTGWVELEALEEPTVIVTFKGYAPVLKVRVRQTGLDYLMYLSAKSIAEGLEPLRAKNAGHFAELCFRIRKQSEDQFAPYEIQPLGR